jgi:hypothetical protein
VNVNVLLLIAIAIAILVGGLPIACILLVTLASRREEAARSIAGGAPGPLARMARRLLGFHAIGISRPACRTWTPYRGRRAARPWVTGVPADSGPDEHPYDAFPRGGFLTGSTPLAGAAARDGRTVQTGARVPAGAPTQADAMALAGEARPGH